MGRLTESAAAGSGARAARWAGSPPTLLLISPTSPGCAATMASSDEDGTNGGASEAGEDREAPGKRRRLGLLATAWLTFYNIAMTAGWLVLALAMVRFYMEKGTHRGLYKSVQKTLKFFQTFALLEIVHCLIGIVPTSVLVTGVQVSSRIFMVWLITHSIKPKITECTLHIFLRYNFFIILYPVGVAGELLTIYAALPYVKKTGMFSIRLPNKYNVSFDYYYFLLITMASYIPLFPQLYFHMLRQRRKVLHGEVIVEKDD
ncbi:very-long-chain (3R)-3-hydroxyacyl-CoA dehydratase 1 isoform X2 [Trachypithecus francoisi]|uniref:very-long-chain (3R)-3-hydroxyacyl-CoA dehydratase 1 isoform X2 n=1 Tax=Trachypithecus francoisi TaxID=54180 RepID=UPI00141A87B0|nr:very-long-chain (3R)-3-hydroxyacyl-CoA dehydratase 1 isoform X2 [Trachypithecus francoisi]